MSVVNNTGFPQAIHGKITPISRAALLDRLPHEVIAEVTQQEFRGRYRSHLAAARGNFVSLTGLRTDERAFFLPLGSSVRLGFGVRNGWGEISGEIIGWSVGPSGGKVMIRCAAEGRIIQRRRYQRINQQLALSCTSKKGRPQIGVTVDLSQDGLCLLVPGALPENERIDVLIRHPGLATMRVSGDVAWQKAAAEGHDGCLVGVQLHAADTDDERRYATLLTRLNRKMTISASAAR